MKKTLLVLVALLCVCVYALPAMAATSPLDDPSVLPETNESGFLPEGESPYVYKNHGEGYWYYPDQTVRIEIMRTQEGSPTMTYYIADIYCNEGTSLYTVTYNEENPGRTNALPQDIADAARAVYAQSGDFYSYRIANDRYPGNIVRNGKVLYEQSYSKMIEAVPNLATMAFYPSGRAEVNEAWEVSASEYVDMGATTVVAFGPILVRDGEIQDVDKDAYNYSEPRSCIGVVEPGHYVGLLVEGRKSHSNGATLMQCAEILYNMGCTDAINLDGGNTAAMLFMGESVQLAENGGIDTNDRAVPDILAVGTY